MSVEAGASQSLGIFPVPTSTGLLLNGSLCCLPSENPGGVSPCPLPHRALSPKSTCVCKTLGHLCSPLTSLLRHPRAPSKCHSVSSALPRALRRVLWRTVGQIRRLPNPLGTNRRWAGALGPRAGPLAPSPAATLAAKVMSAALTYIRSFLRCCSSCAQARWPRSARGEGAVAAPFLGDFRAPLPCSPAPASSPTLPARAPPPTKTPLHRAPGIRCFSAITIIISVMNK